MSRRLLLALLPLALAACQTGPQGRAAYRPDRMPAQELTALVAAPIAQVEAGHDEAGIAAFEALIAEADRRHGPDSLRKADLLEGFGIALHVRGEPRYSEAALLYLRRAIDAYRAYFGPGHPEIAVALNSWADVERDRRPHLPAAAEEALAEAYRIRLAALGPAHRETLWTMIYLGQVRGRLAWTRGEPARIGQVSAEFDRAIALSRDSDSETASAIPVAAELYRAIFFARHGRPAAAIGAWRVAQDKVAASPRAAACRARLATYRLVPLLERPELEAKLAPIFRVEEALNMVCDALAGGEEAEQAP